MSVTEIEQKESLTHEEILELLPGKVDEILELNCNNEGKLMKICLLLNKSIPTYDWVGFYIADPDATRELVLGPYIGEETDHTRIGFGVGICGQVAESKETFVSDDVTKENNYLSCSINVRSEIVVPILRDGEFIAQLDIDSHTPAAITTKDRQVLELICSKLTFMF